MTLSFDHSLNTDNATKWSKLIFITGFLYVGIGGIGLFPKGPIFDLIIGVIALIFLTLWLGFPVVLYQDRQKVFEETDWSPSKLYYLGFLPGYLGLGAILLYLHRREEAFDELEGAFETEEIADETIEE